MLKPEHLTGNVRLVPLDRLPLAIAAIKLLEAVEDALLRGENILRPFQNMP